MPSDDIVRRRWRASQRITAVLLGAWSVVTFGVAFFARELGGSVFGWPFSFWVASQGAVLVYLLLVAIYARSMNRLDALHDLAEDD